LDVGGAKELLDSLTRPSDFDGDSATTGQDFLLWQQHVGSTGYYPLATNPTDANADGVVDGRDLAIWRAALETTTAAVHVAVPEATGFASAAAAFATAVSVRKSVLRKR
jgi:hypothetical protein